MSDAVTTRQLNEALDGFALKLFKYLDKRFAEIDKHFELQDKRIDTLTSTVDGYAKKADDYMQEMLMLSHKVDRLERWIQQMAEVTGVKLEY